MNFNFIPTNENQNNVYYVWEINIKKQLINKFAPRVTTFIHKKSTKLCIPHPFKLEALVKKKWKSRRHWFWSCFKAKHFNMKIDIFIIPEESSRASHLQWKITIFRIVTLGMLSVSLRVVSNSFLMAILTVQKQ